jgi:hypothetical protein
VEVLVIFLPSTWPRQTLIFAKMELAGVVLGPDGFNSIPNHRSFKFAIAFHVLVYPKIT